MEIIHSKINSYLPKHRVKAYNFITSIQNIIFNDTIKTSNISRCGYKTKMLLII